LSRRVLFFAALCYRLALRRPTNPLEALGLPGVQSRERVEGASSARRFPGRFDSPGFPVLYAATAPATCAAEIAHHLRAHYLDRKRGLRPQDFAYTLLEVPIAGAFDDLRARRDAPRGLQTPATGVYSLARLYAFRAFQDGMDGLIYASARHRGGTCVARFLAAGLVLATCPVGSVRFHWTGKKLVEVPAPA
jgi:RES domain-containing protein